MRTVREWVGRNDDERPPPRVVVRVLDRFDSICQCGCQRTIVTGDKWDIDHCIALANGGQNVESNLEPILRSHHKKKTKADMKTKKKIARVRKRHLGLKSKRRSFRTNKDQPFRRKLTGKVERRRKAQPTRTAARRPGGTVQGTASLNLSAAAPGRSNILHGLWPNLFEVRTERLAISRMEFVNKTHLEAMNNKVHMRFSEQRRKKHTITTQREAIRRSQLSTQTEHPWLLCRIRTHEGDLVGSMGCDIDVPNKLVDLSIMILPEHTKKGYGLEAWKAMLDYWLDPERGGMDKVEAGHAGSNNAMEMICLRSMFSEGCRHNHFLMEDGSRVSMVMWGKYL